MKHPAPQHELLELDTTHPVWDRFFWIAPLVLVGTIEADGRHDLAPKHMAFPLGWDNYFAFVCTPRHRTYSNLQRTGVFTVSYPRPNQLVLASLAAAPRCEGDQKPSLEALPVFPASRVEGVLLADGKRVPGFSFQGHGLISLGRTVVFVVPGSEEGAVSYTHLTLPTIQL